MPFSPNRPSVRSIVLACAMLPACLHAVPASAQREIVQALPRAEAADLNAALRRLSANPADLDALLQAGEASLALDDYAAADGFYVRALASAPASGFAKLGLARVRLAQRQPVEALRLFEEAERAGVPAASIAAHRAFAFDLVGDQARAQTAYRTALLTRDEPETRRRLALSLAISGQRQAFEDTIYPLLSANDRASFRTRAFGLAILGEESEAVVIAETMLPTDLALRMAPYLRYMPRLTAAQQAAAANLGVFPRAAEIGRDSAEIAAYAAQGQRIARSADAALTPTGQTLGRERNPSRGAASREQRSRPERRRRPDRDTAVPAPAAAAQPRPPAPEAVVVAAAQPPAQPPVQQRPRVERVEVATAQVAPQPAASEPLLPASEPALEPAPAALALPGPAAQPAPPLQTQPQIQPQLQAQAQPQVPPAAASVADAFADFGEAATPVPATPADAVDITAIRPPREVQRPEVAAPSHPARHWMQVATGRDLAALKFDWRRIARTAAGKLDGKGPFSAPWGQANRLLAGPYPTAAVARAAVNELKAAGLDAFPFASEEGQEIAVLD